MVKFIRGLGATFQHTHSIPGALDGILGYWGIDVRVEFKDPEKPRSARKLTPAEVETISTWQGRRPVIIETEEDVLKVLKELKLAREV